MMIVPMPSGGGDPLGEEGAFWLLTGMIWFVSFSVNIVGLIWAERSNPWFSTPERRALMVVGSVVLAPVLAAAFILRLVMAFIKD